MFIMGNEMWNGVSIYGPEDEIERFKKIFIAPAEMDDWSDAAFEIDFDPIGHGGYETWNFREFSDSEPMLYHFAFDTAAIFPIEVFEDLANLFPALSFECECIADDDSSMGYGWFNTPFGGEDFRADYEVPADYWETSGPKRDPANEMKHKDVVAALKQRLKDGGGCRAFSAGQERNDGADQLRHSYGGPTHGETLH